MAFSGTEDRSAAFTEAADRKAGYHPAHPDDPEPHFFRQNMIRNIFDQEDCAVIRLYDTAAGEAT